MITANDYTMRHGVARSPDPAVLTAPDHDRNLTLALWTAPRHPGVPEFFGALGWRRAAFALFRPLIAGYTPHPRQTPQSPGAEPFNYVTQGFFAKVADGAVMTGPPAFPRFEGTAENYRVNHYNGTTQIILFGDFPDRYARRVAPAHPLLRHIAHRRRKIGQAFAVPRVDVELRFEPSRILSQAGDWHNDGGGRLIGVLHGKGMQFLPEPFINRQLWRAYRERLKQSEGKSSWRENFLAASRDMLGPRFDVTASFAKRPAAVETLRPGELGRLVAESEVKNGAAKHSQLHRRPVSWFGGRVVEFYYPRT